MPAKLSRNIVVISLLSIVYLITADNIMAGEGETCDLLIKSGLENTAGGDWDHIFCGDVNDRKKQATGYHHRPDGQEGESMHIGTITKINKETGVYEGAPVYVLEDGIWFEKKRGSTFFPDHCSMKQVINSIRFAGENPTCQFKNGKWGGFSAPGKALAEYCLGLNGDVLTLNGYYQRDSQKVATAWPLLENKQSNSCHKMADH